MTAAAAGALASQGTPEYLGAAIALAMVSGLFLMLIGFLKLGFLANFLSHPVITGFITASGIQIAAGQLGPVLGIHARGHSFLEVAISPVEMIKLLALLLGVPLVLGMLFNHLRPGLAFKMSKILKIVSLLFFVSLVFLALYNNRVIFMDYIFYVFWIVLLHNLLAFTTGFSLARICGLSSSIIKSITIETGIPNSGLGLLLIFTFFDGLGGMALLAAFWGIWHIVSGLLLASLWGFKPVKKEKLA